MAATANDPMDTQDDLFAGDTSTSFSTSPERKRKVEILETEEDRKYEETARAIAEKVQRQQEGLESAMIADEHKDEEFRTMEEMQDLIEEQVDTLSKSRSSGYRDKGFMSSLASMVTGREETVSPEVTEEIGKWYTNRAKYIPLRLTLKERKKFRLIQAIMKSCDYTNLVDGTSFKTEQRRLQRQVQCVSAVLASIAVSLKYEIGSKLTENKEFREYDKAFQTVFEFGRRYKIMNPEKLRGTYGKMIFLLQDAMIPQVRDHLEFSLVTPIKSVYSVLEAAGALEALKSEWISTATMEIIPDGKSRTQIQKEIKHKEAALDTIARQFENSKISRENLKQCILSIGDNSNYLQNNCKPVDFMIKLLKKWFAPANNVENTKWSLAIYGDKEGSRLTHSHERQYFYVLQSLTLWREIIHDMFRLWSLAEQDLLDPDVRYKLKDTGQGIHRLQPAARTSKAMHGILYAVQQKLGHTVQGWVGSSVIHLGDTNVPNAFVFIDKYNQVPRILNPIVACIKHLDKYVREEPTLMEYVREKFGSIEDAQRTIVHSFFRGAFDGSGGENFFEAGSCIDGRLTSAWNWCQNLPEKPFFPLFRLSGFLSFDGNFQT